MTTNLSRPIAIVDEHPEWSARLIAELQSRRLPFEKIDHSSHAYDPRDRQPRYSVVVNRSSPSSHRRDHGSVLFYAEPLLAHYESLGIPVINPVAAYRFEKSKALQAQLFERLRIRSPRTVVLNHVDQIAKALDGFRFPVVIKPNVGGSGAGIERFDSRGRAGGPRWPRSTSGPITWRCCRSSSKPTAARSSGSRCWTDASSTRSASSGAAASFNLCPADICQVPGPGRRRSRARARSMLRRGSGHPSRAAGGGDRAGRRARPRRVDRRGRHRVSRGRATTATSTSTTSTPRPTSSPTRPRCWDSIRSGRSSTTSSAWRARASAQSWPESPQFSSSVR